MNILFYILLILIFFQLILFYGLYNFALRYNLVDRPDIRKIHISNIPLIGGICIYIMVLISFFLIDYPNEIKIIFSASSILLFIGVIGMQSSNPKENSLLIKGKVLTSCLKG